MDSRLGYGKELLLIAMGAIPYAWSMVVIDRVSIIPGSVLGVSVICNTLLGTPIGRINLLVNIPLMLIGLLFLGRKNLIYTVFAIAGTSVMIDWLVPVCAPLISFHPLIATVVGGALMGVGAGMILAAGATLAGTTLLGRMILLKFPRIKLGNLLIVLDSMIICCGAFLTRDVKALMYSVVYTIICMKVIDWCLDLANDRAVL